MSMQSVPAKTAQVTITTHLEMPNSAEQLLSDDLQERSTDHPFTATSPIDHKVRQAMPRLHFLSYPEENEVVASQPAAVLPTPQQTARHPDAAGPQQPPMEDLVSDRLHGVKASAVLPPMRIAPEPEQPRLGRVPPPTWEGDTSFASPAVLHPLQGMAQPGFAVLPALRLAVLGFPPSPPPQGAGRGGVRGDQMVQLAKYLDLPCFIMRKKAPSI